MIMISQTRKVLKIVYIACPMCKWLVTSTAMWMVNPVTKRRKTKRVSSSKISTTRRQRRSMVGRKQALTTISKKVKRREWLLLQKKVRQYTSLLMIMLSLKHLVKAMSARKPLAKMIKHLVKIMASTDKLKVRTITNELFQIK